MIPASPRPLPRRTTAPAPATPTQTSPAHCTAPRFSSRTSTPARPALAGSRPAGTPTVRAGSRRNAASSSEYGTTAESTATATPVSGADQGQQAHPPW